MRRIVGTVALACAVLVSQGQIMPASTFQPNSVAGLQAWWKADAISGLSDGTAVTTWVDSSGKGCDATQATAGNRPTYKTGIVNGLPVVRWSGAVGGMALGLSGCLSMLSNVTGASAFVVAKNNATAPGAQQTMFCANTSGGVARLIYDVRGDGTYDFGGRRLDADGFQKIGAVSLTGTVFRQDSGVFDYANAIATHYENGTLLATANPWQTAGSSSAAASSGIQIGNQQGTTNTFNGDIAEVLIYNVAVSAANRQRIERYLCRKYALTCA